jgi:hypothetical protein
LRGALMLGGSDISLSETHESKLAEKIKTPRIGHIVAKKRPRIRHIVARGHVKH